MTFIQFYSNNNDINEKKFKKMKKIVKIVAFRGNSGNSGGDGGRDGDGVLNSNHRGTGRRKTDGALGERVPRVTLGIPNYSLLGSILKTIFLTQPLMTIISYSLH